MHLENCLLLISEHQLLTLFEMVPSNQSIPFYYFLGTKKTEAETVRVVSAQVGSSSTLTRVQSIELVTVQMVVSIETLPDVMSPGLQLSVRGVHSHTNIRPKENGRWKHKVPS